MDCHRHRFPWSMNEINRLHNEYCIKELSVSKIARLHQRSQLAIVNMLEKEEIITANWALDLRGYNDTSDVSEISDEYADMPPLISISDDTSTTTSDSDSDDDMPPLVSDSIFFSNSVSKDDDEDEEEEENEFNADDDAEPLFETATFIQKIKIIWRMVLTGAHHHA